MVRILRKLPFYEGPTTLRIPGGPVVAVKHHQIIFWVSVTSSGLARPPVNVPRLPVVFDTGFNDTFLITERQLVEWARVQPGELPWIDVLKAEGRPIPLRDAEVWIHPNLPGFRDQFAPQLLFRLELRRGIGVWPSAVPGGRRLPLLGIRGLRPAGLQVAVDFQTCHLWMRTPRRFWGFGW